MIDDKKWNEYFRGEPLVDFAWSELMDALKEKFLCARCGRNDLPLALMPHHQKSCAFECEFQGSTCDLYDRWMLNEKPELEYRIEQLERAVASSEPKEFRCTKCQGLFDPIHRSEVVGDTCTWCFRR